MKEKVDCQVSECSWNEYSTKFITPEVLNHTFSYTLSSSEVPLSCQPNPLGYSSYQAEKIFPKIIFPTCEAKSDIYEDLIWIDPSTSTLHMKCQGWYYLGVPQDNEYIGRDTYIKDPKLYKKPIKLHKNEEWAFGSCSEEDTIEGATYRHRPKDDVISRVQAQMKEQQKKAYDKYGVNQTMPLTVIILLLDSVSRESFYRNLPKTLEFLKSLNPSSFTVHDFKTHNVVKDNSIDNQYPTWTGKAYKHVTNQEQKENNEKFKDLIEDKAIWGYLKKKGWATMFAAEFCNDYFSRGIGRKPNVDHIMTEFWCGAKVLTGFDDMAETQRCIGNKNSHYYLFNYTLEYVSNYQGLNKWAHVMTVAAHEGSGTVIQSLDQDLADFLGKLLSFKDNIVLFMLGDHGPRYKAWYKTEAGKQEHNLPVMITVTSTQILKEIPFSSDILNHNTLRLVSKYDIYATQKDLGDIPYYRGLDHSYGINKDEYANDVSLIREKIPNDRTCADIETRPEYCSCNEYTELDIKIHGDIAESIGREVIYQMNQNTQTKSSYYGKAICKKLTMEKVEKIMYIKSDPTKEYYKIWISVKDNPTLEVYAFVLIFTSFMKKLSYQESYEFFPFYHKGKEILRILDISHNLKDPFCNYIKSLNSEIPDYCICNPSYTIFYSSSLLITEIQSAFSYNLINPGINCQKFCNDAGTSCSEEGIKAVSTCKSVMSLAECKYCRMENINSSPIVRNNTCVIPYENYSNLCEKVIKEIQVCACK